MLKPEEVNKIRYKITSIFKNLEKLLITGIVKRLCKGKGLSSTNIWQIEKLNEVGALRSELVKSVAKEFKTSVKDVESLVKTALQQAQNNDLAKVKDLDVSKSESEHVKAMEENPELNRITQNAVKACKNAMNLTGTRAIEASVQTYRDAVNKAYLEVSVGTATMADAVKNAVKEIGESGINILKNNGSMYTTYRMGGRTVSYPLDSAIRRDIVTTLNQSAGELTLSNCIELGCDLVETSWHLGARHVENPPHPWSNHDEWQGKVFSLSGTSEKYPPFKESTGYGEVDGLCGINCRHSFSPYYEEIGQSDHTNFPTPEETERHYKELQTQRYYERNIRQLKREQIAYRAGGYDKEARETQARLNVVTAKYNDFLDKTGRTPITALTEVSGYHRISEEKIQIGRSLSAKAKNYPVKLPDGNYAKFKEGTKITNIHTIAGKGSNKELRIRFKLESDYHIPADEWQKKVGQGYIVEYGQVKHVDLHWYEDNKEERYEFKVKSYIDDKKKEEKE